MKQKTQSKKLQKPKVIKPKVNTNFDITKFTFRGDLALVKALRATQDDDKLIDPTQYEDKPEFGEVVKLGERNLKIGDIVRFGKYSTELIRTKGADYYIVHDDDVHAKL